MGGGKGEKVALLLCQAEEGHSRLMPQGLCSPPTPRPGTNGEEGCSKKEKNRFSDVPGKPLLESGSLFMASKNELHEHTGSKRAKVLTPEKRIAPSPGTGRGRKGPRGIVF